MKRFSIFFIILCVYLSACNDTSTSNSNNTKPNLNGDWRWSVVYGLLNSEGIKLSIQQSGDNLSGIAEFYRISGISYTSEKYSITGSLQSNNITMYFDNTFLASGIYVDRTNIQLSIQNLESKQSILCNFVPDYD